ncbi:MAG: hypothetical protein HOW71_03520 [Nonomuraea sp.]|uniref:hypothetical protein n=1 Tax=Streptomyces sp. NBC_00028 TaxID=2975624 RepID=UPI0017EA1642|nr:hypothetical protein [Nonomuraea sp.]NUS27434.1 hypothetical protein [Streptomyces sp.]
MTLPKPVKNALLVVLAYACVVLIMRYRRDGMDWTPALLIGLLATPLVFLMSWGRDRLMGKAERAGRRARARRRGESPQ